MLKTPYLLIASLAVGALGVSTLLMPDRKEMARMQMKSERFEEARLAYEEQLAQGEITIEAADQLSEIYLRTGDVDKAIEVMETFIAAYPSHVSGRTKLGMLYQYAQRQDDYIRNLEAIEKLQPDAETLQKLSHIYNASKQYDKQASTLRKLITVEEGKDSSHYIDLVNVLIADQAYGDAIKALRDFHQAHPDKFTFKEAEMMVSLLLDDKKLEEADSEATGWVQAHPNPDDGARLVALLHFKGNVAMGSALLSHFNDEQINGSAALLEQYVLLAGDMRKDEEAYQRLKALHAAQKLPVELNKYFLFMAASHRDQELMKAVLEQTDLITLSESQLLTLVEIAQVQNDAELLDVLRAHFPEATYSETQPLLMAALAISNHAANAASHITKVDAMELTSSQALHIGRVCAYIKNYNCTEQFLNKIQSNEGLSDAEIADIGALYFQMDKQDKGYLFVMNAIKTRDSTEIKYSAMQYYAARGEDDKVEAWLNDNPGADERTLTDLYFAAANHQQYITAVMIAEALHTHYDSLLARSLLADAYVKTGQFVFALNLLRPASARSETDENNYLNALTQLAYNPTYRKELGEYATNKFNSDISEKEKLILVYTLMNAHVTEYALPYIHELALREGGKWAMYYADTLDKEGRYDESRQFWLKVAGQPSTSRKDKIGIASNLLSHGYKADAEALLLSLADKSPADSSEVKSLLYLWGPRPSAEKMQWLEKRFTESSPEEKDSWVSLYANYATDDALIDLVERQPEIISNTLLAKHYFEALARKGALSSVLDDVLTRATQSHQTKLAYSYGKIARQNGLGREALKLYEAMIAADPKDQMALREAGLIAFEQSNYATSQLYLSEYIKVLRNEDKPDMGMCRAFYYYGELLRRNHRMDEAKVFFEATINALHELGMPDIEALSMEAQSRIWLGDADNGIAMFEAAIAMYPDNDTMRGDLIGAMVDLKRYDEARYLLAIPPDSSLPASPPIAVLPDKDKAMGEYQLINDDRELLIQLSHALDDKSAWAPERLKEIPWVSYATLGYDTLLVAVKPEYHFVMGTPGALPQVQALSGGDAATKKARQIALRYQLLAARIDLETGHIYDATKRLNALIPDYPNDPQLLGFAAIAENYGENWPRAEQLLKTARELSPGNEDLQRFERDMRRQHAQNLTVDHEWIKLGRDKENITTIKGYANANETMQVGASLQNNRVQAKNLRRGNGVIGNVSENRQRGEIYITYNSANGRVLTATLFANNRTPGAGGNYAFLNSWGHTTLTGEIHKPYWELPQAVVDDATRDRLAFMHRIYPLPRMTVSGGLGYNRYNLAQASNVMSSASAKFEAIYRLLDERPFFAIGYGFDGEYDLNHKIGLDSTGGYSRVFPLVSREVHFFSANLGYEFDQATYGDLLAGYGYDRLGGHGPTITGKLTRELNDKLALQLRALYGMDNTSSGNTTTSVGGYVRWRF